MAENAPLQASKRRAAAFSSARLLPCAVALLAFTSFGPRLHAQSRPSQYDVEAAYLLDFGRFTQLSTGSQALRRATFDICIIGRDPIGPSIDKLAANDNVDGRAVRVLHGIDASQARTCAIALIGTHAGDAVREDLDMLSSSDVLTVGDSPDFLNDGGMIQFVMQKNHVRFAVNLNAVRKAHVVLSSQLLRVALYVKGEPRLEVGR
ncbi:MAG: YfiR family protein [Terracidiphilus sp.]